MAIDKAKLEAAQQQFNECSSLFHALGDASRQKLCLDLTEAGTDGINVAELSGRSILSRPAISHHLKVLKDAGIIEPIKRGTQIFYRLKLKDAVAPIKRLLQTIEEILTEEGEL